MNQRRRFHIPRPHIRLFDATGLSPEVHRSLNLAILAVTFSMVFTNITTGASWTGYQRMLGADAMMLGVISAIPVTASTLQILASFLLERFRARRPLFLTFGILSRSMWIVIGLIPYLLPEQMAHARIYALMLMLGLSASCGTFINVSFYSLMGDLVPLRIRGRYFSARQSVSLLAGIVTGLFVSFLIDNTTGFIGYTIVLVMAGVFGAADICCFFFVSWPPMRPHEGKREGLGSMLRGVLGDRGYMRIVVYFTFWAFSVNISGPFVNVFFLEHLGLKYTQITLFTQILPNIATVLVINWWGRKMDRYGNQPIVQLAGLYCMILQVFYLFLGPGTMLLLPIAYLLNGMAWPASDLGQQNMYLARAPARNRSMYVAVFFASTQLLGNALSNFTGGYLMNGPLMLLDGMAFAIGPVALTRYHYIFILSTVLRLICVLGFLPRLREEGDTPAGAMVRDLFAHSRTSLARIRRALHISRIRRQYRKDHPIQEEEPVDAKRDEQNPGDPPA